MTVCVGVCGCVCVCVRILGLFKDLSTRFTSGVFRVILGNMGSLHWLGRGIL